jgi:flagellar hook-associated protein 1
VTDLLGIGTSALLAYRQALEVTGNNIANANTPGYVRQRVELQQRAGATGGVSLTRIVRDADAILDQRARGDATSFARLDTFSGLTSRLDAVLSNPDTGLGRPLQEFYSALNAMAANPTALAARDVVLNRAQTLSARFADTQAQLDGQASEIDQRMIQTVGEINNFAASIAQLNGSIARAQADGSPANDLLDQRDQLVNDIGQRVGVSTVRQLDGTLNLYLGSGQALVLGQKAHALAVSGGEYAGEALDITYNGTRLTRQLSGGTLGGLLDYRREVLSPAMAQLGRLAVGLATSINDQHVQGMDLNGQAGSALFDTPTAMGVGAAGNTGTGAVSIAFTNANQLGTGDHLLRFDGSAWSLTERSSGNVVPMSGDGSPGNPFQAVGLSLIVGGAPAAGDQFLVQPLRAAAGQLDVRITDPRQLAAAGMPATGGVADSGDNSNARQLAALAERGIIDGGRDSISAGYTALVSRVGAQAQGAQLSRDAAYALQQQSLVEREALSGVNLDEEAADLVRWQQAYQAAAQMIATANDLFESLLSASRR